MSIIVIGGGMVGLACGYYLADAGHEVTIIDGGKLASGCSAGNLGYVCPSHGLPLASPEAISDGLKSLFNRSAPFRIKPQADRIFLKWIWHFLRAANHKTMMASIGHLQALLASTRAEYARMAGQGALDCDWQARGMLYLFRNEDAMARHVAAEGHNDGAYSLVEAEALHQLEPGLKEGLAGGVLYKDDACLRPERLAKALARGFQESGGMVIENCRVESIEQNGGQIRALQTSAGSLSADHYVLATGAFSGRLGQQLGLNIPVVPGKGYSLTLDRFDGMPSRPLLFPEEHVGVTPFADGYRIGSMMEFVGFDDSIAPRRIAQLRDASNQYLKTPVPPEEGKAWFGWRPMTPDSLPIIGKAPGIDNLMLATGHNMLGVTLAPVTGKLIAEMIGGQGTHIDTQPFRAERW